MKKKINKIHPFSKDLINAIASLTGCGAQYNNCPCNTCFHSWAETELGLDSDIAHMFWIVVLSLRGDYNQDEIIVDNKENFERMVLRGK